MPHITAAKETKFRGNNLLRKIQYCKLQINFDWLNNNERFKPTNEAF